MGEWRVRSAEPVAIGTAQLLRQEVNVFARDPYEYTNTIFGLVNDPSAWQTNTAPCALPPTVKLAYPTLGGPSAGPAIHDPTVFEDFFPSCRSPALPQLMGAGYGQIQGAIVNDHGLCGASIDVSGIFSQLQQTLWTQFSSGIAQKSYNAGGCADAEQQWFYAAEYINENPNLTPDIVPTGGFDLNFAVDTPLVVGTTPQVAINYSFAWGLQDGILTVSPTAHGNAFNSTSYSQKIETNLADGLQNSVSGGVYEAALAAQAADIAPKLDDCTPQPSFGDVTLPISQVPVDPTNQFHAGIGFQITLLQTVLEHLAPTDGTFATLGLDDSQTNQVGLHPSQILEVAVSESDPANASVYHNWVCARTCPKSNPNCTSDSGGHYRFKFVPRARRLNYYPDSVELIWSDDLPNEVGPLTNSTTTTSGVALYVVLLDQYLRGYADGASFTGSSFAHLSQLCNGTPPGASRSFAVFSGGHFYNSSSDPANCVITNLRNDLAPWNIRNTLNAIGVAIQGFLDSLF